MNKLSCIVTDLDGTLLNADNRIGDEDVISINRLFEMGIRTFLVTGRPFPFAKQIMSQIGFSLPLCACNGGHIYDYSTKKTLYARPIEQGVARRVYDYLNQKSIPYILYTEERTIFSAYGTGRFNYWEKQNERFEAENRFTPYFATDPAFDFDRERILKFLLGAIDVSPLELEMNALFNPHGELSIASSGSGLLDINAAGVNKGEGVLALSEMFGFSVSETMALGDNYNDTEMLKICAYPVAPENAEEEVKRVACFITADRSHSPLTTAVRALFPGLI